MHGREDIVLEFSYAVSCSLTIVPCGYFQVLRVEYALSLR